MIGLDYDYDPDHNLLFYLLPQPLLLLLSQLALQASSPSSVSVNSIIIELPGLLFRRHHQFSQALPLLQARPSRFLVSLTTSPSFWIRGKPSPVRLQNSWAYSLPPPIYPQSQLPLPTSKIQPVPLHFLPFCCFHFRESCHKYLQSFVTARLHIPVSHCCFAGGT